MALLKLENIVQCYKEQKTGEFLQVLQVSELVIKSGEILSVIGPNGCGKSTLLQTLAFLRQPYQGRLLFAGVDVWSGGRSLWARRQVPMLLQQTFLFSTSVLRNVTYGLLAHGVSRKKAVFRAEAALDLVGMIRLSHRQHNELSGGEKRRVALARILALESPVIVLDEPTAGLDYETERLIESAILAANQERQTTVIMASHNYRQAVETSTRLLSLYCGQVLGGQLDNILSGKVSCCDGMYEFRGKEGICFRFHSSSLIGKPLLHPEKKDILSAISLDADGFEISADSAKGAICGKIDSIRQSGEVCRLRLRLACGAKIYINTNFDCYHQLNLNLGASATLKLLPKSVRVLPAL